MKTIPPACPEPETGRTYWRSLDQLADTPEFRQWMEREFPEGASEWSDPVSRRHFVKIMSASFLLAGFGMAGSGCRRPEQRILPFSKMPENYVHGVLVSCIVAVLTLFVISGFLKKSPLTGLQGSMTPDLVATAGHTELIGKAMFSDFLLPFEITSILLLVAIVGSVILAKRKL